jgi:hypothetical protein
MSIVLGWKDRLVTSSVLDQQRRRSSGPATGLGLDVVSRSKSTFSVVLMYLDHKVSVQYKDNMKGEYGTLTTSAESFASTGQPLTQR